LSPISNFILRREILKKFFLALMVLATVGLTTIVIWTPTIRLDSRTVYDMLTVLYFILGLFFIYRFSFSLRSYGSLDPFELPVWLTLTLFFFVILMGRRVFDDPSLLYHRLKGDYAILNMALAGVLLGVVSLWLGYAINLSRLLSGFWRRISLGRRQFEETPRFFAILSIYGIGVLVRLVMIATRSYGYLGKGGVETWGGLDQWIYYLNYGGPLMALAVLAMQVFKGRMPPYGRVIFYLMLLSEVFFTYISGVKGPILTVIFIVVGCSIYSRKSIPWRPVILLVILFILLIPVNLLYRTSIVRGSVNTSSIGDASQKMMQLFTKTWFSDSFAENLQSGVNLVRERQGSLLQNIALAMYYTPEIKPYLDGKSYRLLPFTLLVPRIIWPDKPQDTMGHWFAIEYVGAPANSVGSCAITPLGDLYLNFGWPGIALGMFGLGIVYRFSYELVRTAGRESYLAIYLGLLFVATNYESSFTGLIHVGFWHLIALYFFSRLLYKRHYLAPESCRV
jgi:hypothetical protein